MFRKVVMAAVAAASMAVAAGSAWAGPADDPANWRKVDPENLLQLTIKKQDVIIELRPDIAPKHVAQIKKITRDGNYDAVPFHRVIDDFMAQGGEVYAVYMLYPRPYGQLKAEFTFNRDPGKQKVQWIGQTAEGDKIGYMDGFLVQGQPDETALISSPPVAKTWALHCAGMASMARGDDPNSADTQYFLMRQPRVGPDGLDMKYTVWGHALIGLDVIRGIKVGPEDTDGRLPPGTADKVSKAVIVADIPAAKRPTVYVRRTDGPEFAATLAAQKVTSPLEACNLPPIEVVVERPNP
ncbi:MAG TPA: peptidylprolyl isomerase [Hyphomonadaceae bacterium]|nr:peptidylprolyl isomerase [Hyphomonadaceae bacterium]